MDILSHPHHRPNGMWFGSATWRQQLDSLKPLGLGLLLNSGCRNPTLGRGLSEHRLASEAENGREPDNLLLGCTRSQSGHRCCMCRLANEIGFSKDALDPFIMRQTIITTSRHRRDTLRLGTPSPSPSPSDRAMEARTPNMPSHQRAMPYMSSVVVEEVDQGEHSAYIVALVPFWFVRYVRCDRQFLTQYFRWWGQPTFPYVMITCTLNKVRCSSSPAGLETLCKKIAASTGTARSWSR